MCWLYEAVEQGFYSLFILKKKDKISLETVNTLYLSAQPNEVLIFRAKLYGSEAGVSAVDAVGPSPPCQTHRLEAGRGNQHY